MLWLTASLFLGQLVDTLRLERITSDRNTDSPPTPAPTEIGRAAALHGADLVRAGYRVDHAVHDYGDVCQSVTALAVELWWTSPSSPRRQSEPAISN